MSASRVSVGRRLLDGAYKATGILAALNLVAILLMMVAQSLLREFGVSTGFVNDLVAWCCAAAAFLGMAYTFKEGDFVRVTLLIDRLDGRARRYLEICCLALGTVATGYLAWSVNHFVYDSWRMGDMAQGLLLTPMWIPQASFACGSVMFFIAMADELICVASGAKPRYVAAVERRHAAGDFSSDV